MKEVHSLLLFGGESAGVVEACLDASLHLFDDGFVFAFDEVHVGSGAGAEFFGFPHVGAEADAGEVGLLGAYDVERQAPGVEVEHDVGEQPEVVGGYGLPGIFVVGGQIEHFFAAAADADLAGGPGEEFGSVGVPV